MLAALVLFAAGFVAGVGATRARQQRWLRENLLADPARVRNTAFLRALDQQLGLDGAQRARASALLEAQSAEYRAAIELARPRLRVLRRELARDLAPSLSAAQRASLEATLSALDGRAP